MERPDADNVLVERILAWPRRVMVLTGPAGAGKTSVALTVARRLSDGLGRSHCLVLAPNAPAGADWRRQLLRLSPTGVRVAPEILTFSDLAGRICSAAGLGQRTLSTLRRFVLLQQIVEELHTAGRFGALDSVADTPGLIRSLDRSIAELKRAAVEPDDLARAIGKTGGKLTDLLEVYRLYQQHLRDTQTYDREGQMWEARQVLADVEDSAELPGLAGMKAVVVDGFTDFTPTQLAILHRICRRLGVLITLPYQDDTRRRMWHWTDRTRQRIEETFQQDVECITLPGREGRFREVWDRLFDFEASPTALPAGWKLLSAPDAAAEVAAVARRIKRLLIDDGDGRIAVLARSLDTYRPHIERLFAASDIPLAAAPKPLTDVPILQFLLDVAALQPDWPCRAVLRVLGNSYFRPQALGAFGPREVAAAQMLIREGNVIGGREAYAQAAERLARRAASRRLEDDEEDFTLGPLRIDPPQLDAAVRLLEALFNLAETAGTPVGLQGLIDAMELSQAACHAGSTACIARDLRALEQLTTALRELPQEAAALEPLRRALDSVMCPAERSESLVDVLDVLDARTMRYDHVFLLGLSEGLFPQMFAESALISEANRQAWRQRGAMLDIRGDLTAREMLLFYLAVSRADKTLTVSFQACQNTGRFAAPSSFLLNLADTVGGGTVFQADGNFETIPPGPFIPPANQIATVPDALNAALGGLFNPQVDPCGEATAWAVTCVPETLRRSVAGLVARNRRYVRGACDSFDGRISDPHLLETLASRFGSAVFSAHQLNTYGQCPWQFFARYVLHLEPLTEPQRHLEPVTRGQFVHNVLFLLMSRLRDHKGGPFCLGDCTEEELCEALAQAVETAGGNYTTTRVAYPMLWEIQTQQMHADLRRVLLRQRQNNPQVRHLYFELDFGTERENSQACDPASRHQTVDIQTPAGTVRLCGRIDRVDEVAAGSEPALRVVDYKTGQLPNQKDIEAGRSLQLPLYTEVVEQWFHRRCVGGVFEQVLNGKDVCFPPRTARGDDRDFAQRRTDILRRIGQCIEGMVGGRFDALPTHKCPGYCPYRRICHYSPARSQIKLPEESAS